MGSTPDGPEKTNEQKAMERRQRIELDKMTASSERRLKAVARGKLGKQSLLGEPVQAAEAPEGPTITEGYYKGADGSIQSKAKKVANRMAQRIGVGGAISGGGKSSMLGAVGGKSSKKKKLFGGIF